VGVMRFVRLVAAEGGSRHASVTQAGTAPPLTPEPAGFPPSPARGRGRMLRGAGCSSLCGLYHCAEEGTLPQQFGSWPFTPPPL